MGRDWSSVSRRVDREFRCTANGRNRRVLLVSPNPGQAPLAPVAGTQLERRELGLLPRCRHLLNLHIGRVPRRPGYLVTAAECYTA
jgi:hypothetical protein